MKTVADLKRKVVAGTKLVLIESIYCGQPDTAHKYLGAVRVVVEVKSKAFGLRPNTGNVSYVEWPKKEELEIINDHEFIISFAKDCSLRYRIVDQ